VSDVVVGHRPSRPCFSSRRCCGPSSLSPPVLCPRCCCGPSSLSPHVLCPGHCCGPSSLSPIVVSAYRLFAFTLGGTRNWVLASHTSHHRLAFSFPAYIPTMSTSFNDNNDIFSILAEPASMNPFLTPSGQLRANRDSPPHLTRR
jgi:hypothetical protein